MSRLVCLPSTSGRLLQAPPRLASRQPLRRAAGRISAALRLTDASGKELAFDKDTVSIGAAADSDVQTGASNVVAQHASIVVGKGRVTATALAGDPEDLTAASYTWLNEQELRPGVGYLVSPGDVLSVGEVSNAYVVEFEARSGSSAAMEMMMQGMLAGATDEVKQAMRDT